MASVSASFIDEWQNDEFERNTQAGYEAMTEPTVRRDGTCLVCKGPRPFTPQRSVPDFEYLTDPFCSRKCSEKYFGTGETTLAKTKQGVLESEQPPEGAAVQNLDTSDVGKVVS